MGMVVAVVVVAVMELDMVKGGKEPIGIESIGGDDEDYDDNVFWTGHENQVTRR